MEEHPLPGISAMPGVFAIIPLKSCGVNHDAGLCLGKVLLVELFYGEFVHKLAFVHNHNPVTDAHQLCHFGRNHHNTHALMRQVAANLRKFAFLRFDKRDFSRGRLADEFQNGAFFIALLYVNLFDV